MISIMGKQVHASMYKPFSTATDSTIKALDLLISRGGIFRSSEQWVYDALRPLIESGHVLTDNGWIFIHDDFEGALLDLAAHDPSLSRLVVSYRALMRDKLDVYETDNNFVAAQLSNIVSVLGKLEAISSILSNISLRVDDLSERVSKFEGQLYEIDTALAVVESVLNHEATDS